MNASADSTFVVYTSVWVVEFRRRRLWKSGSSKANYRWPSGSRQLSDKCRNWHHLHSAAIEDNRCATAHCPSDTSQIAQMTATTQPATSTNSWSWTKLIHVVVNLPSAHALHRAKCPCCCQSSDVTKAWIHGCPVRCTRQCRVGASQSTAFLPRL